MNQVDDVRMPLTVDDLFFDIQNERTRRLQNARELVGNWRKPSDVLIRMNAAIRSFATVGVRRGSHNEVNGVCRESFECLQRISFDNLVNRVALTRCRYRLFFDSSPALPSRLLLPVQLSFGGRRTLHTASV